MKLKPTTKIRKSKKIISKEVDGVVYILDPRNSTVHTLNETASFIWWCLKVPRSLKQLISLMVEEFKVGEKKAAQDIEDFILHYLKEELLLQN